MSRQVKIAVVGEIGNRILIADHMIIQHKTVLICQGIAHRDPGIARISLVAVRALQIKVQPAACLCL